MREETFRKLFLYGAGLCWMASVVCVSLLLTGVISTRSGVTSLVVLLQSVAVTLTIVWAQFRVRKIMIAVLQAGIKIRDLKEGDEE